MIDCTESTKHVSKPTSIRIPEIASRLKIGRLAVYDMLEKGVIPAIRINRRWLISRYAYERWERTIGVPPQETAPEASPSGIQVV
jgi:excisionase family DNA binding protein